MIEKNGAMLIIISIMIILFTEIIGLNIYIALYGFSLFWAIIIIILLNLMLKNQVNNKTSIIIFNIIIIGINLLLTKFISGKVGVVSIVAVLILCKFLNKFEFVQIDKVFIKNIVKYYIIPLVLLLIIDKVYYKLAFAISEFYEICIVNYVYLAMFVIYEVLMANIVIIMSGLLFKELTNLKISINANFKSIMIIFNIILVTFLCIKIIVGCVKLNEADNKIDILNKAVQSNNLNTYYEVKFDSSFELENMNRYMMSFNNILIKGESGWAEESYKIETKGIEEMVNKERSVTKKEALKIYTESVETYIDRLKINKENLYIQNLANVIIYLIDIICIFIVYKKSTM